MSVKNLGSSMFDDWNSSLHIADSKKAAVFLATIGPDAFHILSNLVAPRQPGGGDLCKVN